MCMCCFAFGGAGFAGSVRNLDAEERPFKVFAFLEELDNYRTSHRGDFFNLDDEEYSRYAAEFFADSALVMFLTQGMSGSIRCVAEDWRLEGGKLYVRVKELSPPMHTMDLHYNTLAIAVPRRVAGEFDAVYIEAYRVEVGRTAV